MKYNGKNGGEKVHHLSAKVLDVLSDDEGGYEPDDAHDDGGGVGDPVDGGTLLQPITGVAEGIGEDLYSITLDYLHPGTLLSHEYDHQQEKRRQNISGNGIV